MQTLVMENGQILQAVRMFTDGGEPPEYGLSGRTKVLLRQGTAPKPEVYELDGQFFFKNGEFIAKAEDVEHLPEAHRQRALAFLTRQSVAAKKGQKRPTHLILPKRLKLQTPAAGKGVRVKYDTMQAIDEANRTAAAQANEE